MAHRQSFNQTDRPTDRCGDHSDGCRNRLRRYNFQPRPYPSLQRSCALRRVARCSLLGSKTIRRPSGPQRNPLKSLVDGEGFQSSFSGRRTKPQGAGIISGLATIPRNLRLTGLHEPQAIDKFSYGLSDRGASIRMPIHFINNGYRGYLEDRRPNSEGDPYQIVSRILKTINSVPKPSVAVLSQNAA
jgi:hypothetical protein